MHKFDFYNLFINEGDTVFDIGANIGNRTETFRWLAGKVIAVEPQKGLLDRFKSSSNVFIVEKACGSKPGTAKLNVAGEPTISTMSLEWMDAVNDTKRFEYGNWISSIDVEVTTLDALIEEFGLPTFIKIDVEGYESEVLEGLTRPVDALSFEFTPEYLDATNYSIGLIQMLDFYEFNYSLGESLDFELPSWVLGHHLKEKLDKISKTDGKIFGDVYARKVMHV